MKASVVTNSGYMLPVDDKGHPILPRIGDTIQRQPSIVVDCFAGIGTTGIEGASRGLKVIGVELERKFVELSKANIELHRRTWEAFGDPIPVILQGDSRNLAGLLQQAVADGVISSPPYADQETKGKRENRAINLEAAGINAKSWLGKRRCTIGRSEGYGESVGQLGAMPTGDIDAAIGSPPFGDQAAQSGSDTPARSGLSADGARRGGATKYEYANDSPGQLGTMPMGDLAISSPPYAATSIAKSSGGIDLAKQYETYRTQGGGTSFEAFCATQHKHSGDYGNTEGQLSSLLMGSVAEAVVSSPPYEDGGRGHGTDPHPELAEGMRNSQAARESANNFRQGYSDTPENLGNAQHETFWSAARQIVAQTYAVLKPGAVAYWVVKAFVRNKQIVDFPADWRRLCESVGFETIEIIHASLVKRDEHPGLFDEPVVKRKARKSFFRRLYEAKYPENAIDHEVVLVMRKTATPEIVQSFLGDYEMAQFGLIKSFQIDNGELDGLNAQEVFVLGYELAQIDSLLDQGVAICKPVHADNKNRIEASCRDAGREFHLKWLEGDSSESWLLLGVLPESRAA